MIDIGYTCTLRIQSCIGTSVMLDGKNLGPIELKPTENLQNPTEGNHLSVFLYTDGSGKAIASLVKPYVERDQCASLKVVTLNKMGAFLDWGLDKNLFLPYAEQRRPVKEGFNESVYVYLDKSGRLAASSRIDYHLPDSSNDLEPWQAVDLFVYQRTNLGFKAVINNTVIGLLYKDEVFQPIRVGETHQGYIKRVREDGRIDLSLNPPKKDLQSDLVLHILNQLKANHGTLPYSDKSEPEVIYNEFKVSKKNFKKALSTLYKQRKIVIHDNHIEYVP